MSAAMRCGQYEDVTYPIQPTRVVNLYDDPDEAEMPVVKEEVAYGVCRHVTSRSKAQLELDAGLAARIADRHATARHPGRGVTVGDFRLVAVVEP